MNFYRKYFKNVKNDETNTWSKEESWTVRDKEDKLIFGSHGANSLLITETFIPLSREEASAILNHMGGIGMVYPETKDFTDIYDKFPLACILHNADGLASHIQESSFYKEV